MGKIIVSGRISLDGVFDAHTMGQWAASHYSEVREGFIRAEVFELE